MVFVSQLQALYNQNYHNMPQKSWTLSESKFQTNEGRMEYEWSFISAVDAHVRHGSFLGFLWRKLKYNSTTNTWCITSLTERISPWSQSSTQTGNSESKKSSRCNNGSSKLEHIVSNKRLLLQNMTSWLFKDNQSNAIPTLSQQSKWEGGKKKFFLFSMKLQVNVTYQIKNYACWWTATLDHGSCVDVILFYFQNLLNLC
jgi:hypothetical protein